MFGSVTEKSAVILSSVVALSVSLIVPIVDRSIQAIKFEFTGSLKSTAYVTLSPGITFAGSVVLPFTAYKYGSLTACGLTLS